MTPSLSWVRLAATALCAIATSAQDWGLVGAWEQVITTGAGPAGFAFHHPTTVAGSLVFSGTNQATGANTSFALDAASLTWSQFPDVPAPGLPRGGPFSFAIGGQVVLTNEANPNSLYVIDSAARDGWRVVTALGAPTGRDGERFIEWGGVLCGCPSRARTRLALRARAPARLRARALPSNTPLPLSRPDPTRRLLRRLAEQRGGRSRHSP